MPKHRERSLNCWYAAHIIMCLRLKEQPQVVYPVRENIILVQAATTDEAFSKAQKAGEFESSIDDHTLWDDKPAEWIFAGIRKIVECTSSEERPKDGTEITYLELTLDSEIALRGLINGDPVVVTYDS